MTPVFSPYNDAIDRQPHRRVEVVDLTLREGQQAPDVAFTLEEKTEIAHLLADAGVDVIQAGFAGRDEDVVASVQDVRQASRVTLLLLALDPDWQEAGAAAAAAGVDAVEVLIRCGPAQIAAMGLSQADILRRTREVVSWLAEHVPEVWFGPSFATLTPERDLMAVHEAALEAGALRLNIPDTTGVTTPAGMRRVVGAVKSLAGSRPVGVHCHDDFGLALANTLASLEAGADAADVTVNGYGERAGNCALDELAAALAYLSGLQSSVRLEALTPLSRRVSAMTRVPLPADKPISGANAFAQELEIHVQLTSGNGALLEPFPPEAVGNERTLRLGIGTGPSGVRKKLVELDLPPLSDPTVAEVVAAVRRHALATKRVTDEDFVELIRQARGNG